jgi:lysophospholipase L1-like esterase
VAYDGWNTCIEGQDFDTTGLKVVLKCSDCEIEQEVEYELEDNTNLQANQTSIKIKYQDFTIDYPITVKKKYKIACVGDSLTAGHMWPNESYPTYLSKNVTANYEVGNFGVNGISITGYGGSFSSTAPNQRYIKQDVYKNACKFTPDIFAIMLGTNDATEWSKAEPTFVSEYKILLDSFIEQFPRAKFIMMVSPPVVYPNQFGIPNEEIKNYVNPIQRELAEEYGFETLDLREEFEANPNYATEYLRPNNDNVHFTKAAAQYVAGRVWDIAKEFKL